MGPPMQPMTMQMSSGSRKLANKWPSVNTDSGISLFSTDTLTKHSSSGGGSRGELSLGSSSRPLSRTMHSDMHTATLLQESSRRLEDETRRYVFLVVRTRIKRGLVLIFLSLALSSHNSL